MTQPSEEFDNGRCIPFSPLRFISAAAPLILATAVLALLDLREAVDLLVRVGRAAWPGLSILGLCAVVGYFQIYLIVNQSGLTIHYPTHVRHFDWRQKGGFRIERKSLFMIKSFDLIHFESTDAGPQSFMSMFRPPAWQLVELFAQWKEQSELEKD